MGILTDGIIHEVKKVISGKDSVIEQALTAILAGGHILMEDVPGVGKTTMALAFSKTMGLNFGRVQFTPDVLPSDITGFSMYDRNTDTMKYQPGAIFHNLFLADELNRASSRTQSSLLEAMDACCIVPGTEGDQEFAIDLLIGSKSGIGPLGRVHVVAD